MPWLATPATRIERSRTIPAAAIVAAIALAGMTVPASAFIEPAPQAGPVYHHDRYAPAGAAVIGRGIGGLHHRLAGAAAEQIDEAMASCANRFRSYDPSTGTYLGYDGLERPCP